MSVEGSAFRDTEGTATPGAAPPQASGIVPSLPPGLPTYFDGRDSRTVSQRGREIIEDAAGTPCDRGIVGERLGAPVPGVKL